LSKETKQILDNQNVLMEGLLQNEEMSDASKLLRALSESNYFRVDGAFQWPDKLKLMLSESTFSSMAIPFSKLSIGF
jgi:hypothetical protein